MNSAVLLLILLGYLGFLFFIAHWAEKKKMSNGLIIRTSILCLWLYIVPLGRIMEVLE